MSGKMFTTKITMTCPFNVSFDFSIALTFKGTIEKIPRGIQGEKSRKDIANSVKLISMIGA